MNNDDYGPKTGAAKDHPYGADGDDKAPPSAPQIDKETPPDNHTDVDSEADLGDPASGGA